MTVSEDFTSVTSPFRAELLAHCYRMVAGAVLTGADRAGHRGCGG